VEERQMNEKKVAVITGVSSGIGHDLAQFLIEKGYKVYGLSRKHTDILGMESLKCDVQDLNSIHKCFLHIKEKEEKIDALINNAGIGIAGSIIDSNYADIERIFATNVLGTIQMCKEFMPLLKKGSRIVNIGSVAGDLTIPYQVYYSMSKSALDKFSEGLAMELRSSGIRVSIILPGDTRTSFTNNRVTTIKEGKEAEIARKSIAKMENDERHGDNPRKVSKTIYRVLKSQRAKVRVVVGFKYKIFVFCQRILPRSLVLWIIKKLY